MKLNIPEYSCDIESEKDLFESFDKSTVKLTDDKGTFLGTGFYLYRDVLITCYHVVKNAIKDNSIFINGESKEFISKEIISDLDVAIFMLIEEKVDAKFFNSTFKDISIGDKLISIGFSKLKPEGDSFLGIFEGISLENSIHLIKFKDTNVLPGVSGSPLIQKKSLAVVGIVKKTRSEKSVKGGYAIPINSVIEHSSMLRSKALSSDILNIAQFENKSLIMSEQLNVLRAQLSAKINEPFLKSNLGVNDGFELKELIATGYYCSNDKYNSNILNGIFDWCEKDERKYLCILGEFGMGKTISCIASTIKMIESGIDVIYMRASEIERSCTPSTVSLYDFKLSRKDLNNCILVVDSIDELNSSDEESVLKNILHLSLDFKKTILTARLNYTLEGGMKSKLFPLPLNQRRLLEQVGETEFYFISKFNKQQRGEFIHKFSSLSSDVNHSSVFKNSEEINDLTSIPLVLSLMVSSGVSAKNGRVTLCYEKYIKKCYHQFSSLADGHDELSFIEVLQSLARFLLTVKTREMRAEDIFKISLGTFNQEYAESSCILKKNSYGHFEFLHSSFVDFLVARQFVESTIFTQNFNVDGCGINNLAISFIAELVISSPYKQKFIDVCLKQVSLKDKSGNVKLSVLLLIKLGVSFNSVRLRDIDLSGSDLARANFSNSDLTDSNFEGCNLTDVNLTDANLTNVDLSNTFICRTKFSGANLLNSNLWNLRMIGFFDTVWKAGWFKKKLLVGHDSGVFSLIEENGNVKKLLDGETTGILDFALDENEGMLAISNRDKGVKIYDISDLHKPVLVGGIVKSDNIRRLKFDSEAKRLYFGARSGEVGYYLLEEPYAVKHIYVHEQPVMDVELCKGFLFSAGYSGKVVVNSLSEARTEVIDGYDFNSISNPSKIRALKIHDEDSLLYVGYESGALVVWDITSPLSPVMIEKYTFHHGVFCILVLDGFLLVGLANGNLCKILEKNEIIISAHSDIVRSLEKNKDNTVASASWDGVVKIWDGEVNKCLYKFEVDKKISDSYGFETTNFSKAKNKPFLLGRL